MGSNGGESLANRDTPVPVVQIHHVDDNTPSASGSRTHHLSATKLKDKLESLGNSSNRDSGSRMGDKMFNLSVFHHSQPSPCVDADRNRLLSQVLPTEDLSDNSASDTEHYGASTRIKDRRSRTYVERPNFSIPTMSSNFRRFNSRIGVAFIFQNRLIRLFTWKEPTQTLSFLMVWTFLCVDPYLLPVLPLASGMFFVMVPAYLTRHPEPEGGVNEIYRGSLGGPPLVRDFYPTHFLNISKTSLLTSMGRLMLAQ